jgi:hypothetical protein
VSRISRWPSVLSIDSSTDGAHMIQTQSKGCDSVTEAYVQAVQEEIEKLRGELTRVPAFQRLRLLEKHLTEYQAILPGQPVAEPQHPIRDYNRYGRPGSRAALIVEGSEAYLKKNKKRAQTGEIVLGLVAAGVVLPDGNPIGAVSSYLSTSPLFDHVKGEGYGLVEWETEKV